MVGFLQASLTDISYVLGDNGVWPVQNCPLSSEVSGICSLLSISRPRTYLASGGGDSDDDG
jgi:hypothetical protein